MSEIKINHTYCGDALEVLKTFPDNFIDCVVTSPPYFGLRDYGTAVWIGGTAGCSHKRDSKNDNFDFEIQTRAKVDNGVGDAIYKDTCKKCGAIRQDLQIGLEQTPELYIEKLVSVFMEVNRVLKPAGTLWLNLGDSYFGSWGATSHELTNKAKRAGTNERPPQSFPSKTLKPKDLIGIPWSVAFALRAGGWWLRQEIIWAKPNPMPESVTDRCTKSHEQIFLLSKSAKYYFDYEAIQEVANYDGRKDIMMKGSEKYNAEIMPGQQVQGIAKRGHKRWKFKEGTSHKFGNRKGELTNLHSGKGWSPNAKEEAGELIPIRNKRSVWTVNTSPFPEAHFATFNPDLIVDCIKAGCPPEGIVLDPFNGSGTTRIVAEKLGRNSIGIELNPKYIQIENRRRKKELGMFEKIAS